MIGRAPLLRPSTHNHGQRFRAKIVPYNGVTNFGEWFGSESELRLVMEKQPRILGTRYYCEMQKIVCEFCAEEDKARVIASL